jgi:hypothetical protein
MSLLPSSIIDPSLQLESLLPEVHPKLELLLLEAHPKSQSLLPEEFPLFEEAPVALKRQHRLSSLQLGQLILQQL